jgi:hypothetical protein
MRSRLCFIAIGFFVSVFLMTGCKKEPGKGGRAAITGKLLAGNYYSPEAPVTSEDGEADERVYLVYGDKENFDDDVRTSHDGSFEFKYLRKGTYKIFAYSMDPENGSLSQRVPVVRTIEIDERKQSYNLDDLIVYKDAGKGGCSSIKGKVYVRDYNSNFTVLTGQYYSGDEVVYIKYGNEASYSDRIRTAYDGSFEFKNLRKGNYEVFIYSKDSTQTSPSGNVPVVRSVEINAKNQNIDLGDIVIID